MPTCEFGIDQRKPYANVVNGGNTNEREAKHLERKSPTTF